MHADLNYEYPIARRRADQSDDRRLRRAQARRDCRSRRSPPSRKKASDAGRQGRLRQLTPSRSEKPVIVPATRRGRFAVPHERRSCDAPPNPAPLLVASARDAAACDRRRAGRRAGRQSCPDRAAAAMPSCGCIWPPMSSRRRDPTRPAARGRCGHHHGRRRRHRLERSPPSNFPAAARSLWLLPLPLAFPTYIVAYVYVDLLGGLGPVQSGLRAVFGCDIGRRLLVSERPLARRRRS